jgi:hypothetical protein
LITRIIFGDEYRSSSSSLCSLHSPVASSLLGPNILLSTLFSNTLSLFSSRVITYRQLKQVQTAAPSECQKHFTRSPPAIIMRDLRS